MRESSPFQATVAFVLVLVAAAVAGPVRADETCMSPYMAKITAQEDFVYVWTLGEKGVGDESDKLVTIDVRPGSKTYGKVVSSASVGGRHEAHHAGFTDDRRFLWANGLDSSAIFVFDVASDPARPRLVRTIDDFVEASGGVVGPHGAYALPGRMLIAGLSNAKDKSGRTALVEYSNSGEHLATHWMPTAKDARGARVAKTADGYGYDVRALPRRNVMFSSSFTGWSNYMRDFGEVVNDAEAMKRFGQTVVVWDLHARRPREVLDVPGAPLEIRVALGPRSNYAFTASALTSKLWLIHEKAPGDWEATAVADIGDPAKVPLPVDISLAADDATMWVTTFADGTARLFDVSNPHKPREVFSQQIGRQVNMVSQSWDGARVYFSSSLLAKWDKKGEDDEQFVRAFTWDGKRLAPSFAIDFYAEKLGRPHIMRFGAYELYGKPDPRHATQKVQASR